MINLFYKTFLVTVYPWCILCESIVNQHSLLNRTYLSDSVTSAVWETWQYCARELVCGRKNIHGGMGWCHPEIKHSLQLG